MVRPIYPVICMFVAAFQALPALAAGPHFPSSEDIRQIRETREVHLASDGIRVLAVITDSTADGGRPHLWLLNQVTGEHRQLTFSNSSLDKGEDRAAWAPDGSAVFFLADRGGGKRLYRLPMSGGEAEPLALSRPKSGQPSSGWGRSVDGAAIDAEAFAVSPDGRTIALIASDGDEPDVQAGKEKKDDAAVFEREEHRKRLYLVEAASGSTSDPDIQGDVFDVAWSPRADRLVALAQPQSDDLGPAATAWLIGAGQGGVTQMTDLPKTVQQIAWPSDDRLAYLAQCEQDAPPGCHDLFSYDLRARRGRDLTADLEASLPDDARIVVDKGGAAAVLALERGLRQQVTRIPLDGGQITYLDVGQPVVTAVATNPAVTGWVFLAGSAVQPIAPFFSSTLGSGVRKLPTPEIVPSDWLAAPSIAVEWRNKDQTIAGLLYLPPNKSQGPVPLVVHIHGGPAWQFTDQYYAIVNLFVGQGWAVFEPNPRGSSGRGARFMAANKDDLGGEDFNDVMTGVDSVLAHFPVDPNRMALVGYSYGGEMAGFAAGKTQRFKAIVSGAPVIDQFSEFGTEDSSWYDRWYFGKPSDRFEAAWRQSPLSFVAKARTPVLLLQGSEDESDPLGQSLELYRALHQAGDEVQLITFPREKHLDLHRNFYGEVSLEPWHGVDLRNRMVRFITEKFDTPPGR